MSKEVSTDVIEKKSHHFGLWFIGLLILGIGAFALYTYAAYSWSFSEGERTGYVQKMSQKGWICKTNEGELLLVSMPGTLSEKFLFTVPDPAVVNKINANVGKKITLHYKQHLGLPSSCFGDTNYFINDAVVVNN